MPVWGDHGRDRNIWLYPRRLIRLSVARVVLRYVRRFSFLGVHIGGAIGETHPAFREEFAFVLTNSKLGKPARGRLIPIPAAFLALGNTPVELVPPLWDLCYSATMNKSKGWGTFFRTAAILVGRNRRLKVLVIMLPLDAKQQRQGQSLFLKLVPAELREQFTIINLVSAWPDKGLPNEVFKELLSRVKVFAMFSRSEGTSKSLVEALAAGCKVVAYRELAHEAGGALPGVADPAFDVIQMDIGDEIHAVEGALSGYNPIWAKGSALTNRKRFDQKDNVAFMVKEISKRIKAPWRMKDFNNLHLMLPAHGRSASFRRLPTGRSTSDLTSVFDWWSFFRASQKWKRSHRG